MHQMFYRYCMSTSLLSQHSLCHCVLNGFRPPHRGENPAHRAESPGAQRTRAQRTGGSARCCGGGVEVLALGVHPRDVTGL